MKIYLGGILILSIGFIFVAMISGCSNQNLEKSNASESFEQVHTNSSDVVSEPVTEEEFCGFSTGDSCNSDADCVEAGCSSQACIGKNRGKFITTCEYMDCYDNDKYGLQCKCVEGKCDWD